MTIIGQNFEIQNQRIIFKGQELPVRPGITPAYLPEVRKKPATRQKKYNFPTDQGGARSFVATSADTEEEYLRKMNIA